jgi:hypothetical protein
MTRAVTRILLSLLSFPLAGLLYTVMVIYFERANNFDAMSFVYSGIITWGFLAAWWYWIWRTTVRWTPRRWAATAFAAGGALAAGAVFGVLVNSLEREVGFFIGSTLSPLLWLVMICLIWRETEEEHAARVAGGGSGPEVVVCLKCKYPLTGLTAAKCPECGSEFTLDQLFAGQPARLASAIE